MDQFGLRYRRVVVEVREGADKEPRRAGFPTICRDLLVAWIPWQDIAGKEIKSVENKNTELSKTHTRALSPFTRKKGRPLLPRNERPVRDRRRAISRPLTGEEAGC
ncbi:hypothetical protein ACFE04_019595 [Oxalis oulophora]